MIMTSYSAEMVNHLLTLLENGFFEVEKLESKDHDEHNVRLSNGVVIRYFVDVCELDYISGISIPRIGAESWEFDFCQLDKWGLASVPHTDIDYVGLCDIVQFEDY